MEDLDPGEARYVEHLFDMHGGQVLDYSDRTFDGLFSRHGINIRDARYLDSARATVASKANMWRGFLKLEPEALVGEVLSEMLDDYVAACNLGRRKPEHGPYIMCRRTADRLSGRSVSEDPEIGGLQMPDAEKLPVDAEVSGIIQARMSEARLCMSAGAYLSVVILCGSVLEAVLLGAARREQEKFYCSRRSPMKDGRPMPFSEWSLADFADVARDIGLLKGDPLAFSHMLLDFKDYVRPAGQAASGFVFSKPEAETCLRVLVAALADISRRR